MDTLRELPVITGVPQLATALMAPKRDSAGQEKRDKNGNAVPLLPHHLNRWAVKNESDFFIHKDLRRFLSGELDYFLKSVVLNLNNLLAAGEQRAEPNSRLLDVVKHLGTEIVDFVSQLEDFQKALFEKKKFVIETSWCLTLDRIPANVTEEVYAAIIANDQQWEEWETIYKISEWPAEPAKPRLRSHKFLEMFPYLMFDTALGYSTALIERLLSRFNDLDDNVTGLLIHSENLQALRLLQNRFSGTSKVSYIDPPYNTDVSAIPYKNNYRHSSWGTLMANRVALLRNLIARDGAVFVSIDKHERRSLEFALDEAFGEQNKVEELIWSQNTNDGRSPTYSTNHEYILVYAKVSRVSRSRPCDVS
ncbi:MAG: adenine-specific DNA-methyltransferase [Chthoniobacter sp.]|jgi:adenine-specific DNA-methyltransferase|nr:adenine-specific DNA-methyltransferase [Chthoniobacter sp.]